MEQHPIAAQIPVDGLNVVQAIFDFFKRRFIEIQQFITQIPWRRRKNHLQNPSFRGNFKESIGKEKMQLAVGNFFLHKTPRQIFKNTSENGYQN